MACFGSWVAAQKERSAVEGALLGFLFGPFGVLIEAHLPSGAAATPATSPAKPRPRTSGRSRSGHDYELDPEPDPVEDEADDDVAGEPQTVSLDNLAAEDPNGVNLGIIDDRGLDGRKRTKRIITDEDDEMLRALKRLGGR